MSKSKQAIWLFWIMFCTASATFLGYGGCSKAEAQDEVRSQVVPHVTCPSTSLCVKGEQGLWIPIWYARDLLGVREELKGRLKELEAAKEEITSLRIADAEHLEAEKALELTVAYETKKAEVFEARMQEAEDKSRHRLQWGVGVGIVGAVVIGALAATLGTAH